MQVKKTCLQLIDDVFVSLPDNVFGPACQTDVVYEEGAKDVAMSALTGINGTSLHTFHIGGSEMMICRIPYLFVCFAATIFAYGQTSSGKTFTMRGVTESAVSDIYKHIDNVSFIYLCKSLLCAVTQGKSL
jgi:centromeric protein E